MGRFLVLGTLGSGGMGVVVEAHDEQLERTVALKLLRPEAAQRHEARLLREAQALARLSHPNVVQIYDVGVVGEQAFIAMELVAGSTLGDWRREPRPWREIVARYLQAARGLAAAHAKDLVHRDFKPENCILGEDDRVRVVDFGLAREVSTGRQLFPTEDEPRDQSSDDQPPDDASKGTTSGTLGQRLTRAGVVLGTLQYMSLEQLQGLPADARTDQYSFCAALYEALFDVLPYEASSPASLLSAMLDGRRTAPPGSAVPRRLRRALERGLSLRPPERWPSMDALIAELEGSLKRRGRWGSGAAILGVGVALGGGLALSQVGSDPCTETRTALEGVWDDDARARVAEVFARLGPSDAGVLAPRITAVFDAYAQGWEDMSIESCTATFVTRRQSEATFELRARCLERRFSRMGTAIEALVEAEDPEALVQSAILPFQLPSLARCAELETLAPHAGTDDLVEDERHVALRRALDHADGLRARGRYEDAREVVEGVIADALALESPRIHAEAMEHLGRIFAEGGPVHEAKAPLEQAIVEANRADLDEVSARAWLSLLYANAIQDRLVEAQHQVVGATAAVERTGDPLLRAWLLNDLGIMASQDGDHDVSIEHFEAALALKEETLGTEHLDVGIALSNLGAALTNAQRHEDAREPLARARTIFEHTVGRSSSLTTYALVNACSVEQGLGRHDAALDVCGTALARLEESSVASIWHGRARWSMAQVLWAMGRRAEARALAQEASEVVAEDAPEWRSRVDRWLRDHPL